MALKKILHFPNPRLRLNSEPVEKFDSELHQLIDDMFETMYEDNGLGLAAPQIDIQKQIVIIDFSQDKSQKHVFINPEIISKKGSCKASEGCLSVPGIFADVKRAETVMVRAFDKNGKIFELEADDYLARCIQHELDHLNGTLFIDHLSTLKQNIIKRKIEKQRKKAL